MSRLFLILCLAGAFHLGARAQFMGFGYQDAYPVSQSSPGNGNGNANGHNKPKNPHYQPPVNASLDFSWRPVALFAAFIFLLMGHTILKRNKNFRHIKMLCL
jgi:hypothetical protein